IAGTIKITCLDAFDTDQEINVLAYPKTWQVTDPIPIAGKIIVGANSKKRRIPVKFIFVKVKTDILNTGVANTGTYGSLTVNGLTEINNLDNTLFQCFFDQEAVFAPDLDLTANKDLKAPDPKDPTLGKYIDPVTNSINFGAPGFRSGLRTLFLQVKDGSGKLINAKYSDAKIFTVFSFNEPAVKNVIGAIEAIGTRNLVLFSSRDTTTLNHEVLHGFGLRHTHKESSAGYKVLSESKYTYPNALNDKVNCTDNVMSYNDKGWTTWNWQWTLLRSINQ
ncbi:MAG TPA: hypothetical protein VNV85_03835, partial [Puia sp.]|nr:hypothetical protein [Puia sp.]